MCDDSSQSVQKEHTVKTLIVGRKGVGKTTLFNTYKSDIIRIFRSCFVYRPKDDASKVLGVMYGDIVKINIWDFPHVISRDEAVPSKHVAGCGVIILMYDVTNLETFEKLVDDMEVIKNMKKKPIVALFANKTDLEGRIVTSMEGIQFAKRYLIPLYFELTAKDKEKVQDIVNKCVQANHYKSKFNASVYTLQQMFGEEHLYKIPLPTLLWKERTNLCDIEIL